MGYDWTNKLSKLTEHSVGVLSDGDVGGGRRVGEVVGSARFNQVCQWHSLFFTSISLLLARSRPCLSLGHFSSGHLHLFHQDMLFNPDCLAFLGKNHLLHVLGSHLFVKSLVQVSGIRYQDDPGQSVCPCAFFIAVI